MNVLWLAPYPHPIRSNRNHAAPWMTSLARKLMNVPGFKLTIVSASSVVPDTERFTHEGIDFVYVKVPADKYDLLTFYQQRIQRVQQALSELAIKPDIIHIHGSESQYQVMAAKLIAPKVLSVQGIVSEYIKTLPRRFDYRHFSWRVAEKYESRYMPYIQHYICRTHWDNSVMRLKAPNATIHHNWEMMRPEFYEPIKLANNPTALLYVGGMNRIKGINELLISYNQLVVRHPNLRLIIAGTGTKYDVLALVKKLKLNNIQQNNIEHRGILTAQQLWNVYHEVFCLVHPSHIDNSPNSVCEAQLSGLPVVATEVGGVASLIKHRQTGLLVPINSDSITEAICSIIDDPLLRQNLAQEALRVASIRHNIDTIVQTTCSIYSTVISTKKAAAHDKVIS